MFGVKNFRFQIEDFRLRGTVGNFAMTRNQGKSEIYNLKLPIVLLRQKRRSSKALCERHVGNALRPPAQLRGTGSFDCVRQLGKVRAADSSAAFGLEMT